MNRGLNHEMIDQIIDGSLIIGVGSVIVSFGAILYTMWTRQQQMIRDIYGSDLHETRDGILLDQATTREEMQTRFDSLESHVDSRFDEFESRMSRRHDELSYTLARIIDQMDDPPEDIYPYGPYEQSTPYETGRWSVAREYNRVPDESESESAAGDE